jgi:FkbM family methyltransferase
LEIFDQIFTEKQYQWHEINKLAPRVILDAGSNIGLSAIYFSNLFPDAKILCVEPSEENYALLLKNTAKYPNITALKGAIWARHETLGLVNPEGFSAGHAFSPSQSSDGVTGYTIDELIKMYSLGSIDILKMDIEGAEKEIFESEDLSWMDKVSILVIELHDMYRSGTSQPFIKAVNGKIEKMYFKGENIICFLSKNQ